MPSVDPNHLLYLKCVEKANMTPGEWFWVDGREVWQAGYKLDRFITLLQHAGLQAEYKSAFDSIRYGRIY